MKDYEVCRVCVKVFELDKLAEIFDEVNNVVLTQFKELTGLSLPNSVDLPNKICISCKDNLHFAYEFQKQCIESQKRLAIDDDEPEINDVFHQNDEELVDIFNTIEHLKTETKISPKGTRKWEKEKSKISKNRKCKTKLQKDEKLICELCGNSFKHKYQLNAHVQRHTGNKPFECELCQNKFFTNSELNRHMRSHTGEKPFACKFCHRKFSDHSTIIKHERTHTDERPFKCDECEKRFNSGFILKNHKLTHTGLREFSCEICDRSFQLKQHLITHMKSLTHLRKAFNAKEILDCD